MKAVTRGALSAAVSLCLWTGAQATTSNVVLNLEGNPTCSSLVANDEIMEARDNGPSSGVNAVVGADGQIFQYTVTGTTVTMWNVASADPVPVNFTILKGKGNAGARVFHFGADGVFSDSDEEASGTLSAVSFCYGLSGGTPPQPPQPPQPMATCEGLTSGGGLSGTGISCPATGEQRVLISMSLEDEDDFNLNFCTCNVDQSAALPQCNPNLTRFEDPDASGEFAGLPACTNNLNGVNTRVPVQILGVENPNSYICFTSGGRRVCYGHF